MFGKFGVGKKFIGLVFAATLMSTAMMAKDVIIRDAPPRPVFEAHLVRPGPSYVWIDGYQRWNGARYVWVPGAWVVPPRPHAHWVEPRYVHRHGGWVYLAGHWR